VRGVALLALMTASFCVVPGRFSDLDASESADVRALLLPLRDRSTVVVELPAQDVKPRELPSAEPGVVIINAGTLPGRLATKTLVPSASSFVQQLVLSSIEVGGVHQLEVRLSLAAGISHRLRVTGRRLYVDLTLPKIEPAQAPAATSPPAGAPTTDTPRLSPALTPQEIVDRARALAAKPDVRGLMKMQDELPAWAERSRVSSDTEERLRNELDRLTEAARAQQLALDRKALLQGR